MFFLFLKCCFNEFKFLVMLSMFMFLGVVSISLNFMFLGVGSISSNFMFLRCCTNKFKLLVVNKQGKK